MAPKSKMEKIDHLAIEIVIERIAESSRQNKPKRKRWKFAFIKKEQKERKGGNHSHSNEKQIARLARKQPPCSARIRHKVERKRHAAKCKDADSIEGIHAVPANGRKIFKSQTFG